jgi:uncharacterized membrane protein YdjX (TVP38/TMEM64 family)
MNFVKSILLVLLVIAIAGAVYYSGLHRELTWAGLAARQADLKALVAAHPLLGVGAFIATYAIVVTLLIPGGAVMTAASGLLFGTPLGAIATIAGATLGATCSFLIVRSTLGRVLARRAGPFLERMRPGLQRDAFSTVMAFRLIPVFPFWLVNIVPAVVGIRLWTFVVATMLGIAPATLIYASIGAGIGDVLAAGGTPDLTAILQPGILLPLLGLAALSMVPVLWRRFGPKREGSPNA